MIAEDDVQKFEPATGVPGAPSKTPCELCRDEGNFAILPASYWNTTDERPVPVCPMHRDAKKSVSWEQGLRMFLVWKVNSE